MDYACSFCGKEQNQVIKLLVNREGLAFCNECAQVCVDFAAEESREMGTAKRAQ